MKSTIGYLLHAWKNLSTAQHAILNDEVISDNPEGGTGKGIVYECVRSYEKVSSYRW